MSSIPIPLQIVEDEEFQAIEIAIAAAESASSSFKLSDSETAPHIPNPRCSHPIASSSAVFSETLISHLKSPGNSRKNGSSPHQGIFETLNAEPDRISQYEASKVAGSFHLGSSEILTSGSNIVGFHPGFPNESKLEARSAHLERSETIETSGVGTHQPFSTADDACSANLWFSETLNAESDREGFHLGCPNESKKNACSPHLGSQGEAKDTIASAHPGLHRKSINKRRLPSWQCSNKSCHHTVSRFTSAEIKQVLEYGNDNQPSSKPKELTLPESLDGIERFPWGLAPSSCKVATKCKFPSLQFKGRIIYSSTVLDVENAAYELLRQVKAKKAEADGGSVPLGFDTEWKVIFKRGAERRKVAVLQLCIDADNCNVFHIIHSGIPLPLQNILEDPLVVKVGVGAYGDAAKLRTDYNVNVKGVKDLSGLANLKLGGSNGTAPLNKNWSLSSLAEELLGKQVDKNGSIRMGDWEVNKLSAAQLQYAATDAFVSLYLFQVLLTFPDTQKEDERS